MLHRFVKANWLYREKTRSVFFQVLFFLAIALLASFLFGQVTENLQKQNIASGFGFLSQNSGFEISESLVDYSSDARYGDALWVGLLNTLMISFVGNILAVLLGFFFGALSFSKNFLVKATCRSYVEFFRNIPLLLQLFFWYVIFNEILPPVAEAYQLLPGVFFSNRGVFLPWSDSVLWKVILWSVFIVLIGGYFLRKWSVKRRKKTAKSFPDLWITTSFIVLAPLLIWFIGGRNEALNWSFPHLEGFNFQGGISFSPEFSALLLGLVLYTGAFNAEVVRSGLESVQKGQWEAGQALGLSRVRILSLLIIPQAMRVIVPPLTSQILNLTKNSSLAVAIAYPDFVNVANTTLNQTGQAVELVALIMLVYLTLNLVTSFLMNLYNKRIQLVER